MKKYIYKTIIPFLALLSIISCTEKEVYNLDKLDSGAKFDFHFAAPLFKGSLSFNELETDYDVNMGFIEVDNEGTLVFKRTDTLSYENITDFSLDEQDFSQQLFAKDFNLPDTIFVTPLMPFSVDTFKTVSFGGEYTGFNRILFQSGKIEMHVQIESALPEGISIEVEAVIENLKNKDSGNSFRAVLNNEDGIISRDLTKYELQLPVNVVDSFNIDLRLTFASKSFTGKLVFPNPFKISFVVKDAKIEYAEGKLGRENLDSRSSEMYLPFFDPAYLKSDDNLELSSPEVIFSGKNVIGIPMLIEIFDSYAIKSSTSDTVPFLYFGDSILIPSAQKIENLSGNITVIPSRFSFSVNKDNSNIKDLVSQRYDKYLVNFKVIANPDTTHETINFLYYLANSMKLEFTTYVPIEGKFKGIGYTDTLDFDFYNDVFVKLGEDSAFQDNIEYLELKLKLENPFGLNLKTQLYQADDNFMVMDSLLKESEIILNQAETDNIGNLISKGKSEITLRITQNEIESWKKTKHLIFRIESESTPGKDIVIRSNDVFDFSLGFEVKGYYSTVSE